MTRILTIIAILFATLGDTSSRARICTLGLEVTINQVSQTVLKPLCLIGALLGEAVMRVGKNSTPSHKTLQSASSLREKYNG